MYCPQCGQHQADDVRYCSRCGLLLQQISTWLNGESESLVQQTGNQVSPRRRHILRAAKVAVFSSFLLPLGFIVGQMQREPQWFAIPLLIFFASLVWMLYARLFIPGIPMPTGRLKQVEIRETNYLAPSHSAVVALPPHRVDTAEIAQPPSVTEYTTNLLRQRED